MKISCDRFLAELRDQAALLELWARECVTQICCLVEAEIGSERFSTFFKIDPKYRIKTEHSALAKFDRWESLHAATDIHDLAGARFVVLLRTDLDILERVIKSYSGWSVSRERHFEDQANDDPEVFDYQSVHFVVRGTKGSQINGHVLTGDVSCEIQIRTLLQHAYAELCHDKIYKDFASIPPSAKRLVARSMALMETTDLIFCETVKEIDEVSSSLEKWLEYLGEVYGTVTRQGPVVADVKCRLVLETFFHLLSNVKRSDVAATALSTDIQSRILERCTEGLFSSPACVLTYWLVENHFNDTKRIWPDEALTPGLQNVCADLGIAYI